ncbi:pentapeptide repeat-containing protein [Haladaptatus salinisoli]|uniref:pentapeptide repeat-containing protein n=1 Tax=Haladaptatus salinisoli TaxID=2884876 RepID=UPI001D0B055E|nr:pentapeptide repeat-containing protein [Haladaptatus salinisoli]
MPDATKRRKAVLDRSPEERERRGHSSEDVQAALLDVIERGSREEKVFTDVAFPELDLDYADIEGANKHPVVFRNCAFEGVRAEHADVKVPVSFEGCTVDGLDLEGARFEYDATFAGTTFTDEVATFEARFDRDADFTGATFSAPVIADETRFEDDASFADATFESTASFRGAEFHGKSNALEDHASFAGARFEAEATFLQSSFEFSTFAGARFAGPARFQEVRFDGDADFSEVAFEREADFDEVDFGQDATFEGSEFRGLAVFRGAEFEGGARSLQDDARFVGVAFRDDADFRDTHFRDANFDDARFDGTAVFEEAWFDADVDFRRVEFAREADFDEARFAGDADFSESEFRAPAVFRGAEFEGDANHLEDNATFADVWFADDADFDNAKFTSANFLRTRFGGVVDFFGATFDDRIDFLAEAIDDDTYVDFTDAKIKSGVVEQPADEWVRYDFTLASLGDVTLDAGHDRGHRKLLDYFRFCKTEFSEFDGYEFDFSAYTEYLDRNDWRLHTFDENAAEYEYAAAMTPETVETTYLKAKNAASAGGYVKAAGEFRIKRQQYARRKHVAIVRDASADVGSRFRNLSRAAENYFLDVSCGHGMRLTRIMVVFFVAPLFPALLYAFGGSPFLTDAGQLDSLSQLATPEGQSIAYKNLHFSYITYLTIGYGGIGPTGALARLLAGLEVYLSVILGGLFLYALVKRSEL